MFYAVIKRTAGVRRVHITEEKEMTQENETPAPQNNRQQGVFVATE